MEERDASAVGSDLVKWLAEFKFGGNDESPQLRMEAIDKFVVKIEASDIEHLVRLAFQTKDQPSETFVDNLRTAFQTNDPSFPSYGNDREMVVLAGMILFETMHRSAAELSAQCALSIATASVEGVRSHQLPADLPGYAEARLNQMSDENSRRPDLSTLSKSLAAPKINTTQAIESIPAAWDQNAVKAALTEATKAVGLTISGLARQITNGFSAADRFMRQQDEELQMLWWLLGGRAFDFDCNFENIPIEAKPLVFAAELAGHTVILPGPMSIKALLSRAGLPDSNKIALCSILASIQEEWLKKMVGKALSPVLHPIHFAIERQLENGKGEEWVKGWANRVDIPEDLSFTPLSLAVQVYREKLLLNAVSGKML